MDFRSFLADTAGLHDTNDPIETLGIEKTMKSIEDADMIVFMVEAHRAITPEDYEIYNKVQSKPFIIAINKIDLVNGKNPIVLPDSWMGQDCVEISALYDRGLEHLKEKIILAGFGKDPIDIETAIVPNLRQKLLMEDSLRASEASAANLKRTSPWS